MGTEYGSSDIRNIAVLGHGGSGKTTLVDAMCFIAGSTTRRGSVDDAMEISHCSRAPQLSAARPHWGPVGRTPPPATASSWVTI